jgi:hypothetical protein
MALSLEKSMRDEGSTGEICHFLDSDADRGLPSSKWMLAGYPPGSL